MITGVVSDIQLTVDLTNICWMNITYDDLMRPAKPHWKLLKTAGREAASYEILQDDDTDHQELHEESDEEWGWPLFANISNLKTYIFPNTAVVRYGTFFDSIKYLDSIFVCFTWECIFLLLMYSEQLKT